MLLPNGTPWGDAAAAQSLAARLAPAALAHLAISDDPGTDDSLMRRFFYFAHYADLIVTVEGWLMHAAWCLAKPYRVLMAPYSQRERWFPHTTGGRQGLASCPAPCGPLDPAAPPPLVEQPRKFVLQFLVRELGRTADPAVLPFLRKVAASPDRDLRRSAAEALASCPHADAAADVVPLLADPWNTVRGVAARALLDRGDASRPQSDLLGHFYIGQAARDWTSALQDDDPVVRREARAVAPNLQAHIAFRQSQRERRAPRARLSDVLRLLLTPRRSLLPPPATRAGTILILTPLKDAAACFETYCDGLRRLTWPHRAISLGFLESDSRDDTFRLVSRRLPRLRREFRRAALWKRDFGYQIPFGIHRAAEPIQVRRRATLARSRNHLLFHALDDEEWVLWLDADVVEYPPDIIERLLAVQKDIVQPHCVLDYGGPTFDRNAWADQGRLQMEDLRTHGDLVELHAVGGAMLLVRADLHRDGLVFPPFPYGRPNPRARPGRTGELETEGLGLLAHDMGHGCWGLPNLEIRHQR